MKLSSKPISSPGRAEKYPPPLMRFLRSNVGSRSRGRSRSSPMFVRKKNTTIETQEPSSPKVTCMGQVRVRRSKQSGSSKPGSKSGAPTKNRCKWFKNAFSCHHFTWKQHKPKTCRPNWRKWVSLFRVGFKRKSKSRQDSSKFESKFGNKSEDFEQENEVEEEHEDEDEEEEATKVFMSTTSLPPKNALMLMRCRSAPYRSSSLASRFWGSPLTNQETEQEQENNKEEEVLTSDKETEEKLGFFKEFEASNSIKEKFVSIEELKTGEATVVQPLILTRCKSEPARTAEKLDPDLSYWNKRRLGFT